MGFTIDPNWQHEVFHEVKRYGGRLRDITEQKAGWEVIEDLLQSYVKAAELAMGSVPAKGGYPTISFHGATAEYWKALSIYTVADKNTDMDLQGVSQYILRMLYDDYVDSTVIWEHTQNTKNTLSVNDDGTVTASGYARTVEEGGTSSWGKEVPARPLFSVLNEGFLTYIREQLRDKKSSTYRFIRKDLKKKGLWT